MITIRFSRESVSMGDDAGAGSYTIEMPDDAVLGDLIGVIRQGGNGNDWPIPYTGANSFWVIRSDAGDLADVYTDGDGEWVVRYLAHGETTFLKTLGITRTYGARGLDPADKRPSYNGYIAANMTGKQIRKYLSGASTPTGPYHHQVPGEKIMIQNYAKIQDDARYLVYYSDSFFKIMDEDTGESLYFITYIKKKPRWGKQGFVSGKPL